MTVTVRIRVTVTVRDRARVRGYGQGLLSGVRDCGFEVEVENSLVRVIRVG